MKHYLTDADRLELTSKLRDAAAALPLSMKITNGEQEEGVVVLNDRAIAAMVQVFSDFYAEKNTFTDAIREAQKPRIWKVMFRKDWMSCLFAMDRLGRPVTTLQIASELTRDGVNPLRAREAARHFVEARHWRIIEETPERSGQAVKYRLTSIGINALRNPYSTMIKRFVYTMNRKVTPTPDGKDEPDIVSIASVCYIEKRTKEEHVRDSATLDEQRNPALFV
jgi:hypothetical protein